jgi:hypothetical protein
VAQAFEGTRNICEGILQPPSAYCPARGTREKQHF